MHPSTSHVYTHSLDVHPNTANVHTYTFDVYSNTLYIRVSAPNFHLSDHNVDSSPRAFPLPYPYPSPPANPNTAIPAAPYNITCRVDLSRLDRSLHYLDNADLSHWL